MTQNINVNKIHPHPHNPRRDLGDLIELAESIKAKGILQNLTLVPYIDATGALVEGEYTSVIGHRRHAAAKLAGLAEVPCVISDMSEKEQIATMLLENIQRNDLTIYEQAQGFQMMLDLGETVNGIADQTGFSESTVRRRVKLLELDPDKFEASIERGATLMDYAELEKTPLGTGTQKTWENICAGTSGVGLITPGAGQHPGLSPRSPRNPAHGGTARKSRRRSRNPPSARRPDRD